MYTVDGCVFKEHVRGVCLSAGREIYRSSNVYWMRVTTVIRLLSPWIIRVMMFKQLLDLFEEKPYLFESDDCNFGWYTRTRIWHDLKIPFQNCPPQNRSVLSSNETRRALAGFARHGRDRDSPICVRSRVATAEGRPVYASRWEHGQLIQAAILCRGGRAYRTEKCTLKRIPSFRCFH